MAGDHEASLQIAAITSTPLPALWQASRASRESAAHLQKHHSGIGPAPPLLSATRRSMPTWRPPNESNEALELPDAGSQAPFAAQSLADYYHGHRQQAPPKPNNPRRVRRHRLAGLADAAEKTAMAPAYCADRGRRRCMAHKRRCMTFDDSSASGGICESALHSTLSPGYLLQRGRGLSDSSTAPGQPGFDGCTAVLPSSKPRRVQQRPRLRASPAWTAALSLGVTNLTVLQRPGSRRALEDLMPEAADGAESQGRGPPHATPSTASSQRRTGNRAARPHSTHTVHEADDAQTPTGSRAADPQAHAANVTSAAPATQCDGWVETRCLRLRDMSPALPRPGAPCLHRPQGFRVSGRGLPRQPSLPLRRHQRRNGPAARMSEMCFLRRVETLVGTLAEALVGAVGQRGRENKTKELCAEPSGVRDAEAASSEAGQNVRPSAPVASGKKPGEISDSAPAHAPHVSPSCPACRRASIIGKGL
ncbi:hypothetical protein BU16DRAFT_621574 [Lophium mytilinum]|uniref:Uncharacterized protein n=1 Tax=Lophium mytilinum TaxID=390894 RepID=A0A6A6QER4_9PEZI|nr:hypothetical protein BU16DRAFT_621574 [Lophium mytilinum]